MAQTDGFEIDFDDFDFEFSSGDGVNTGIYSKLYEGFEIDFDDFDFEFSSGDGTVIINTVNQSQNGVGFILNVTGRFYDYGDTMFEILLDEDLGTRKKSKLIPVLRK